MYNGVADHLQRTKIKQRKREVLEWFGGVMNHDHLLDRVASHFSSLGIDIETVKPGTPDTLRMLAEKLHVQISVYDEVQAFRRVMIVPERFDPVLEQINLLRCDLLSAKDNKTKNKKTTVTPPAGIRVAHLEPHYHALRCLTGFFLRLGKTPCLYCGEWIGIQALGRRNHRCQGTRGDQNVVQCRACKRPRVARRDYAFLRAHVRPQFCEEGSSRIPCDKRGCQTISDTHQCSTLHRSECHKTLKCENCSRTLYKTGKYAHQKFLTRHDNCQEHFCNNRKDWVVDESLDCRRPAHTCYIQPLKKNPPFPSICTADFETETMPDGQMRVNVACLVSPKNVGQVGDYVGRIWSDVGGPDYRFRGVKLGEPFDVEVEDCRTYLTQDLLRNGEPSVVEEADDDDASGENRQFQRAGVASGVAVEDDIMENVGIEVESLLHPESLRLVEHDHSYQNSRTQKKKKKKKKKKTETGRRALKEDEDEEEEEEDDGLERYLIYMNAPNMTRQRKLDYLRRNEHIIRRVLSRFNFQNHPHGKDPEHHQAMEEGLVERIRQEEREEQVRGVADPKSERERNEPERIASQGESPEEEEDNASGEEEEEEEEQEQEEEEEEEEPFCQHETAERASQRIKNGRRWQAQAQEAVWDQSSPALDGFVDYLYTDPEARDCVILFHYGSRFDVLLLTAYLSANGYPFRSILVGHKNLGVSLQGTGIHILDFYSYMSCPLRKLVDSLNLKCPGKGFFPHSLNSVRFYDLNLPHLPPLRHFAPEDLPPDQRMELQVWHETNYNTPWNCRNELLAYCLQDTVLLCSAALRFEQTCLRLEKELARKLPLPEEHHFLPSSNTLEVNGNPVQPLAISPFNPKCVTISTYANQLFRKYVVPRFPEMALVFDESPGTGNRKSSRGERRYLGYLMQLVPNLECVLSRSTQNKFQVTDASTGKSHTFWVDGYANRTVYEYLGCWIHGHPRCLDGRGYTHRGMQHCQAHERTLWRKELLLTHPEVDRVEDMYECEFEILLERQPGLREHLDQRYNANFFPLDLRSTFRGGICENFGLLADSLKLNQVVQDLEGRPLADGGLGKMVDFTSYYPSMYLPLGCGFDNRADDRLKIPMGPPLFLRGDRHCQESCDRDCSNPQSFRLHWSRWNSVPGCASVRILPPRSIRYPLLRISLTRLGEEIQCAPLCRTCAESSPQNPSGLESCPHSESERCLIGSWTFIELDAAVKEQGYRLLEVYESVFFNEYKVSVFEDILSCFAKVKTSSEGYPAHVDPQDAAQCSQYARELSSETGLDISPQDIFASPALKSCSKLILCAIIGKMGQIIDRSRKAEVHSYQELTNLRSREDISLSRYQILGPRTVLVT